ncbi:MAG: YceI family protein [Gammaproteobacteria bacterium]|nr:YceI family protein [Gammaproteobacteria bacterium]
MRWRRCCISALAGLCLAGCASAPPPQAVVGGSRAAALEAEYTRLARAHPGSTYRLDPAASSVAIYVLRGGLAAKAGHNHVLEAPTFTGYAYVPERRFNGARFDLEFRLDRLLDDPRLRERTGGAFAGRLSSQDIADTRRHMLGPDNLQATDFPWVEIRSRSVVGEAPVAAARVAITLHGVTRQQDLALRIQRAPGRLAARGALVLRQSDFGVKPYSVLGGLLAVEDPVIVRFDLVGVLLTPTGDP